jgi:hypothetical protein
MRHQPDRQYEWILHAEDHFSKFSCLYLLKSKQVEEVADNISLFIGALVPEVVEGRQDGVDEDGARAARMDEWIVWETVERVALGG